MSLIDQAIDLVNCRVSKWERAATSRAKGCELEARFILSELIKLRDTQVETSAETSADSRLIALGYQANSFRRREWTLLKSLVITPAITPAELAPRLCVTKHTIYVYLARIKEAGGRLISVHGHWEVGPIIDKV